MDKKGFYESARNILLPKATESLINYGRYWSDASSETIKHLKELIEERGLNIIVTQPLPNYEFVISLNDSYDIKQIEEIANERSRLKKQGTSEDDLPV